METEKLIPLNTFCQYHAVESSFVYFMHENDLVQIEFKQGKPFLYLDELPLLEKMVRLHEELDINPEGLQAVFQLLQHVEDLQREVDLLRRKLRRLEP
ncbi:MAG: chaperone modulator CbpM [Allomuricauda sp.]|mgnify:CR=1 FL=1